MRKLKSEFRKDEAMTLKMKVFFNNAIEDKHFEFIGVYYYKNYEIYFYHVPENKKVVKHIKIRELSNKKIKQDDLELIANHFVGDNYSVQYGLFNNDTASIWEEKSIIN